MRHELKCWPWFFQDVLTGKKTCELRYDDERGFQVGDELLLEEYRPEPGRYPRGEYTGRKLLVDVSHLIPCDGSQFVRNALAPGWVVMSIRLKPEAVCDPSKSAPAGSGDVTRARPAAIVRSGA